MTQEAEEGEENLLRALGCFRAALTVWTREANPGEWAATASHMGCTYTELPAATDAEVTENLYKAAICFNAVAETDREAVGPTLWAAVQNRLGKVYFEAPETEPEQRRENLHKAMACHEAALTVWSREVHPDQWASAHFEAGNVYCAYTLVKGREGANMDIVDGVDPPALKLRWAGRWAKRGR